MTGAEPVAGQEYLKATIIVPCVEVDSLTRRCVQTCSTLFPGVEIIVLSDVPDTKRNVVDLPGVKVEVTGKVTIAAKRNTAARLSALPFLALIDSDAYPDKDWASNAVVHLESDAGIWAVGGPNLSPMDRPSGERFVGSALKSPLVSGKWTYRKRIEPARRVDDLPSCNLIVRRDRYLELGGMDEALITGEDMEFCARLRGAGGEILYTPDVLVFHKARNLVNFIAQRLTYGTSVPSLVRRRQNLDFIFLCLPAAFVLFMATGFLGVFWPLYGQFWLAIMTIYAIVILVEAIRNAGKAQDIPGVAIALFLGNVVPGIGTLCRLIGLFRDPSNIYRNDR